MSDKKQTTPTAAILVIGNEILSGRVQDLNVHYISGKLNGVGIKVVEVRIVPDIEADIVASVNALRERYTYVFSTGGIGPTHDDITAPSMAVAFGVELIEDAEARARLEEYYTKENLTPARLLMARVPKGSTLIDNPATIAPGFRFENVFVMAGVPSIMQAMMDGVTGTLEYGPQIHSTTVSCQLAESTISEELGMIATLFPMLDIGSYPSFRVGHIGLALVVRGTDKAAMDEAVESVVTLVKSRGVEPKIETK